MPLSRRRFLRNMSMTGAAIRVGLPPLAAMFNSNGTAYAATAQARPRRSSRGSCSGSTATGFPSATGSRARSAPDYELTPCLAPLESLRDDIHVISGIDNPAARVTGAGQQASQVDERRWSRARRTRAAAPAAPPSIR